MTRAALRIGLIGAGSIAAYHVDGVRGAGDVIQAVAASNAVSAARAAERFAIPYACVSWRELLTRPDLDAVIAATPDGTHEEIALACIAAARPVMIQKPLAASSDAARRIVTAGRRASVPVFTSYMHRHLPETRRWREMTEDGSAQARFGPVLSVRLRNATPGPDWGEWFFDRDLSGGVVPQIGIHGIDTIEHLIGPIREVVAMTALRLPERRLADGRTVRPTVDDHASAVYRTEGGVLVSHEMCYAEVAGTDRFALDITCERAKILFRSAHGALAENSGDVWRTVMVDDLPAAVAQHSAWSRMLRGEAPHDGSDLAGLQGLLVADAIAASAETGARIAVQRTPGLLTELTT